MKKAISFIFVLVFLTTGYFSMPSITKSIVESKFPGVTINGDIHWQGLLSGNRIHISDIDIDRKNINGKIDNASASFNWLKLYPEDIRITGGSLNITYQSKSKDSLSPAQDLPGIKSLVDYVELNRVEVKYSSFKVVMGMVAASKDIVKAEGGFMIHPSIGTRFGASADTNVLLDFGVKIQEAHFTREFLFTGEREIKDIIYKRLTVRLGLIF